MIAPRSIVTPGIAEIKRSDIHPPSLLADSAFSTLTNRQPLHRAYSSPRSQVALPSAERGIRNARGIPETDRQTKVRKNARSSPSAEFPELWFAHTYAEAKVGDRR